MRPRLPDLPAAPAPVRRLADRAAGAAPGALPAAVVLSVDLTRAPADDPARGSSGPRALVAAALAGGTVPLTLREVVETLHAAADDPRVAGLVARLDDQPTGPGRPTWAPARVQEVRDAVAAFAATGRPCVAHAETFGELAPGTALYYLATAFPTVALQPSGDVGLVGVAGEVVFLRGALDKAGVQPQLDGRHEYKNARDQLVESSFTDAHREAADRVVESVFEQVVQAVATTRGLAAQEVRALVDRAPLSAADAREAGLVDRLAYRDEVLDDVLEAAGPGAALVPLTTYRARTERRRARRTKDAPVVALVTATGPIVTGRGRPTPLGAAPLGADMATEALRRAGQDDDVVAVVLRVDSPGGSAVASDAIGREVGRLRAAGRPVVVSMGDVAASGGYWISADADAVVAHPATLTGSIGVVGGKLVTAGLRERVGLGDGLVQRGANAAFGSSARVFDHPQWMRLQAWLDEVYERFVARVAAGRGLSPQDVHAVARGRVWTGADAAARGLVDRLGGLPVALQEVRRLLDLAPDAPVRLVPFPPPVPLPLALLRRGSSDPAEEGRPELEPAAAAAVVGDLLPPALADVVAQAVAAAQPPGSGVLLAQGLPRLRW